MGILKMIDAGVIPQRSGASRIHFCKPPVNPEKYYGHGTIWECDECGHQFFLEFVPRNLVADARWHWANMSRSEYLPSQRSS